MPISIFIENPAGLALKHHFDEERGVLLSTSTVSRPYPYPYGFVLNAPAADGDNLDCFVLTRLARRAAHVRAGCWPQRQRHVAPAAPRRAG